MTRRARTRRRSVDPALFLRSDGWSWSLLTTTELLPSREHAEAAWERCRADTWRLWREHAVSLAGPFPFPPGGARCFDRLVGLEGTGTRRTQLRRALAALAAFRATAVADEIADVLDTFEEHLRRAAEEPVADG